MDDDWEWHPDVLAVARELEARFERGLRELGSPAGAVAAGRVPAALTALVAGDDGPPVGYLAPRDPGAVPGVRAHRSIYHLKEADPHTWAIPRLAGAAKAALVEIQADEYGGGRPERMHAELFPRRCAALGPGRRLRRLRRPVPAVTLRPSTHVLSACTAAAGAHSSATSPLWR